MQQADLLLKTCSSWHVLVENLAPNTYLSFD